MFREELSRGPRGVPAAVKMAGTGGLQGKSRCHVCVRAQSGCLSVVCVWEVLYLGHSYIQCLHPWGGWDSGTAAGSTSLLSCSARGGSNMMLFVLCLCACAHRVAGCDYLCTCRAFLCSACISLSSWSSLDWFFVSFKDSSSHVKVEKLWSSWFLEKVSGNMTDGSLS